MSVVTISVISAYSLMKLLALAGLLTSAEMAVFAMQGNNEARKALKKNMLEEIAAENGRVGKINDAEVSGALRRKLAEIRSAVENNSANEAFSRKIFEEMNALSLEIRRAEVDEARCREREEAISAGVESIRSTSDARAGAELGKLMEEIERVRALPVEDRMAALQGIADRFAEIKDDSARQFMSEMSETRYEYARAEDNIALLIRDIRDLADRVASHDEIEGERLAPVLAKLDAGTQFPGRLESFRAQLKALWGNIRERAAATLYFRETLLSLRGELAAGNVMSSGEGAALLGRCDVLLGAKFIERPDFMKLYEDIAKFVRERGEAIADSMFAGRVKDALESLGYEIVQDENPGGESGAAASLEPGAVRYLDSPYEGYRVMMKADKKGSLAARLVRVEDPEDAAARSSDERELLDREAGRKWCRDFDTFLGKMKDMGLPMDVSLRQEPEDVKLMTVAGQKKKRGGRRKKADGRSAGHSAAARGNDRT
ncbi:MAG: hypothetical protein LBB28_05100 [Synergistaceae bacterium]|nr:hypothetical protein [Synergistaceae bacterium]